MSVHDTIDTLVRLLDNKNTEVATERGRSNSNIKLLMNAKERIHELEKMVKARDEKLEEWALYSRTLHGNMPAKILIKLNPKEPDPLFDEVPF